MPRILEVVARQRLRNVAVHVRSRRSAPQDPGISEYSVSDEILT